MTPCSACARHVKHDETACPFCGAPFAAPAPRSSRVIGRVTRAAVFSAALVACHKHEEPTPAPKAGSAEHLDQDFNQLLGSAEVQQAPADAAIAVAADAAVDAGPSDEERTRALQQAQQREQQQKQHADDERRRRELEQQRLREQQQENMMHNAKPYGAPPARRRVV